MSYFLTNYYFFDEMFVLFNAKKQEGAEPDRFIFWRENILNRSTIHTAFCIPIVLCY